MPSGADGMLLRHVLHDWGDADALAILANCRRALPAGGRVLVAEVILPEDDAPSVARHMDLSMLVLAGGQERTEREYRALCDRAGLSVTKVIAHRDLDQPDRGSAVRRGAGALAVRAGVLERRARLGGWGCRW